MQKFLKAETLHKTLPNIESIEEGAKTYVELLGGLDEIDGTEGKRDGKGMIAIEMAHFAGLS